MRPIARRYSRYLAAASLAIASLAGTIGDVRADASRIFNAFKDRVLQVQMLDRASDSKASIGSGFLVSDEGHVVTNFHVIAEAIYKPAQYRARYVLDDGRTGELKLRAIDVVHDLALLQAQALSGAHLALDLEAPRKGDRLYAFGNPHDLGLTIVEGTYNGPLEKSLYDKIHFTGSINAGMSGGPAVNAAGAVVGVNVSTAGNQLSFLVPARYVSALIDGAGRAAGTNLDFTAIARDQLLANQARYLGPLLAAPLPRATMNGFTVPGKLADFLNCWGNTELSEEKLYEWAYQSCSTADDLYLSAEQGSGVISFSHELFATDELGPVRFFRFLEERFRAHRPRLEAKEEMVTNFRCESGFIEHDGLTFKTVFCLRAYKKFDGLFDAFLKAAALTGNEHSLQSNLFLAGVSYDNATRFARVFLEAIDWKP